MLHRNFQSYVSGAIKIGISLGVVSLLGRWITGSYLFGTPQLIVKYGLLGVLGFALMKALALMAFGGIGHTIRQQLVDGVTLGDFLRLKLHPFGYWLLIVMAILLSIESLYVEVLAAGTLINDLWSIPQYAGKFIFVVLCTMLAVTLSLAFFNRLAVVQMFTTFAIVMLLPLYFFIQHGVEPVYSGIRLYHPYLLFLNNHEAISFILVGIIIGLGQVFIDPATWQRLFMMERDKIVSAFLLSGVIWIAILLAFCLMVMIAIYKGGFDSIYIRLYDTFAGSDFPLLLILLFSSLFIMIIVSYGAKLHALIFLIMNHTRTVKTELKSATIHSGEDRSNSRTNFHKAFRIASIIGLSIMVLNIMIKPTLVELLYFFGIFYASLPVPLLAIILLKGKVHNIVPLSALIGCVVSIICSRWMGSLNTIWMSGIVSAIVVMIHLIFSRIRIYFLNAALPYKGRD